MPRREKEEEEDDRVTKEPSSRKIDETTIDETSPPKTLGVVSSKGRKRSRDRTNDEIESTRQTAYVLGYAAGMNYAENVRRSHEPDRLTASRAAKRRRKKYRPALPERVLKLLPTETRLRRQLDELKKLPPQSDYVRRRRKMLTRALELLRECIDTKKPCDDELTKLLENLSISTT